MATPTPTLDWLPGYPRDPFYGLGLNWTPDTPWKVGLHSTESPEGSAPGIIAGWRKNPGAGLSHFIADRPDPKHFIQLLPFSVGAYTAQNPEGGIDTNRAHLIQIECCNYAVNPSMGIAWPPKPIGPGNPARLDWSDEWYDAIAQWLSDLVRNGIPLDLHTELAFPDHWTGFPGGGEAYVQSAVVLDHALIPEQPGRHWDIGLVSQPRLLRETRVKLGNPNPQPPGDDMSEADVAAINSHTDAQLDKLVRTLGGYHQDDRKVIVDGVEHELSDNITEAGWSGREYFGAVKGGDGSLFELVRVPTGKFLASGAPQMQIARLKVGKIHPDGSLDLGASVVVKLGRNPHVSIFEGDEAVAFLAFPDVSA